MQGVEEDPVISCPLKIELVTQIAQQTKGSLNVNIGPQYVPRATDLLPVT